MDPVGRLVGGVVGLALAACGLLYVTWCLRKSRAFTHDWVDRRKNPVDYWIVVGFAAIVSMMLAVMGTCALFGVDAPWLSDFFRWLDSGR